jgi:hypothetical protein
MVREVRRSLTGDPWRMQLQGSSGTSFLAGLETITYSAIVFLPLFFVPCTFNPRQLHLRAASFL